uniref:Zinc-finger domain-containing protein n=1 Tax=Oryza nivara TaxID=4536 RepID=A0A0E0GSP4_ORYNI
MGSLGGKSDYESVRDARISENLARMEMLGLRRCAGELSAIASASASASAAASRRAGIGGTTPRRNPKPPRVLTPLRRSGRLVAIAAAAPAGSASGPRRSGRLNGQTTEHKALPLKGSLSKFAAEEAEEEEEEEQEEKKAMVVIDKERVRILQERRCDSKGRGAVYDPVLGICCHFCRQKKLCGEEGCKRCGEGDLNQPCIGKTDCSSCHSSYGILCRACLKVRYGEDMDEVRKNKNWMCPHCIEEKGTKKFWICNSSICLKKRKLSPTGIAIYDAREQGYESVAHLLMDKLKCRAF